MKRIRLICMMAVVAIVTAVCCSFTFREDRNHFSVIKIYTDPNSHMNIYRVAVPGRVYYVLHNTAQGGLCKLQ